MFTTLIMILIVLAAFALIWWGIGRFGLPEPIKTVILVIAGLIALAMIWNFINRGGLGSLVGG